MNVLWAIMNAIKMPNASTQPVCESLVYCIHFSYPLVGYTCRCKSGWADSSTDKANFPGRNCRRSQKILPKNIQNNFVGDQCRSLDCAPEAECRDSPGGPICQCQSGFVDVSASRGKLPGRICRRIQNECQSGKQ
jgi:hypothetical protein